MVVVSARTDCSELCTVRFWVSVESLEPPGTVSLTSLSVKKCFHLFIWNLTCSCLCLSFCHWALLKWVWFHILYCLSSGICRSGLTGSPPPSLELCQLSQPLLLGMMMVMSVNHLYGLSLDFLHFLPYILLGFSILDVSFLPLIKTLWNHFFTQFSIHLTVHFDNVVYEDVMRDKVKSHAEVKVHNRHYSLSSSTKLVNTFWKSVRLVSMILSL